MSDDINEHGSEVLFSNEDGSYEVECRDNDQGRLVIEHQIWDIHPHALDKQIISKRLDVSVHDAISGAIALLERFAPHRLKLAASGRI